MVTQPSRETEQVVFLSWASDVRKTCCREISVEWNKTICDIYNGQSSILDTQYL